MLVGLKELICVDALLWIRYHDLRTYTAQFVKDIYFTTQKWLVGMDSPNHAGHAPWLAEAKKTRATFQPI